MKKFTTHPAFFVFIILVLSPMVGVYDSSSQADSLRKTAPITGLIPKPSIFHQSGVTPSQCLHRPLNK